MQLAHKLAHNISSEKAVVTITDFMNMLKWAQSIA
jgi:hypothetical protein